MRGVPVPTSLAPVAERSVTRRWTSRARTAAILTLAAACFVAAFWTRPKALAFETQPWLLDFWQLEDQVLHHYPNLSWAIETQAVHPRALHEYTENAIQQARSDDEAEKAIRLFVRAFRDRHFTVDRGEPPRGGGIERYFRGRPGRDDSSAYACSYFKFEERPKDFLFPFEKDPGFVRLPGSPDFPAGILAIGPRRLGIVRIATFDTWGYASACRLAWSDLRRTLPGPCDGSCENDLWTKILDRVLQELSDRARQMQLARVDSVILDLTGNPGGHFWSFLASRMFVSKPLPYLPVRFSRSEETAGEFRTIAPRIRWDLRLPDLDPASCRVLEESLTRTEALMTENHEPCDPGDIWWKFGPEMLCSNLTRTEYWSGGLLPLPPEHIPAKWRSEYDLSFLRSHPAETRLYDGPLAVLVDRRTGSAAELVAGQLQDWAGATVIGERSSGSGGGWMFGDKPTVLLHSHLRIHIPDHSAYRRDGSNTVAGVTPDVCVPWSGNDSPDLRSRKLRRLLAQL